MTAADTEFRLFFSEAQAAIARGQTKKAVSKLWRAASLAARENNDQGLETVLRLANAASTDNKVGVSQDARTLRTYCQNCLDDIRSGKVTKKKTLAELFSIKREER